MSFTLIETLEDLKFLNQELLLRPFVAVDTEFRRTTKDNMKLALLQINDTEEIYLVDPILIGNPDGNCTFLSSDSVVKIFHSCKEDIEAVFSWTGEVMLNLFDTQLAEAFLNGHYSIGYQGLVEEKLGITVDKGETRSNWIRRPLTDSQLSYAASDVEFLIELHQEQEAKLIKSNKLQWHDEELNFLTARIFKPQMLDEERSPLITKAEERELLFKFNDIVNYISEREEINNTLFFSKKSQRDFLNLSLKEGLQDAFNRITLWRRNLLQEPLVKILGEI